MERTAWQELWPCEGDAFDGTLAGRQLREEVLLSGLLLSPMD